MCPRREKICRDTRPDRRETGGIRLLVPVLRGRLSGVVVASRSTVLSLWYYQVGVLLFGCEYLGSGNVYILAL